MYLHLYVYYGSTSRPTSTHVLLLEYVVGLVCSLRACTTMYVARVGSPTYFLQINASMKNKFQESGRKVMGSHKLGNASFHHIKDYRGTDRVDLWQSRRTKGGCRRPYNKPKAFLCIYSCEQDWWIIGT